MTRRHRRGTAGWGGGPAPSPPPSAGTPDRPFLPVASGLVLACGIAWALLTAAATWVEGHLVPLGDRLRVEYVGVHRPATGSPAGRHAVALVRGTVWNPTGVHVRSATVQFGLYDADGVRLGLGSGSVVGVAPREAVAFDARVPLDARGDVFEVETLRVDATGE